MSTEIAETIYKKVKHLPIKEQEDVLQIIESKFSNGASENSRPIWEVITEMNSALPEEVWADIPSDASINVDHYLYDAPKKQK